MLKKPKNNLRWLWISLGCVLVLLAASSYWLSSQSRLTKGKATESQTTVTTGLPKNTRVSDWQLVLVNKQHPQNQELNFTKTTVDDKQVDTRIVKPLADFRKAALAAGYPTTLVSGYRSIADQRNVFANVTAQNERNGLTPQETKAATEAVVQTPGSSEHQTGLAVDLAGNDALAKYPNLEANMDQFASQQWLIKHAPNYGFVLRFLPDKKSQSQTGIDYESWHFRYVGYANAQYMTKHHLTLEQYLTDLKGAGQA
ncbi:M15 family metallopeptidase [Convivina praedatoris]|uniref:D-alanyl-D-alanine carboxypeptidase-like core domain-containing protein n=1 Tax=Convivina praedatoris TaxID=2880963 RepID=A0ABM9D2M9_9LACO|nr:M15 family metallopeptidase [Convivina sp. LMG 32447]CAH1851694.1 hypothetical protein LMG032447_00381 [Convivina sp. LMG 32447]CAH1851716.1 hypothetical protein R078138_00391 [Convivina sp. LMG 32447]CAH1853132.1 hypothetical protein R077815_00726 [Convivina sp. LMG 32447]